MSNHNIEKIAKKIINDIRFPEEGQVYRSDNLYSYLQINGCAISDVEYNEADNKIEFTADISGKTSYYIGYNTSHDIDVLANELIENLEIDIEYETIAGYLRENMESSVGLQYIYDTVGTITFTYYLNNENHEIIAESVNELDTGTNNGILFYLPDTNLKCDASNGLVELVANMYAYLNLPEAPPSGDKLADILQESDEELGDELFDMGMYDDMEHELCKDISLPRVVLEKE